MEMRQNGVKEHDRGHTTRRCQRCVLNCSKPLGHTAALWHLVFWDIFLLCITSIPTSFLCTRYYVPVILISWNFTLEEFKTVDLRAEPAWVNMVWTYVPTSSDSLQLGPLVFWLGSGKDLCFAEHQIIWTLNGHFMETIVLCVQ